MGNKNLDVLYKFHGKDLAVEIANKIDSDLTVSKVELVEYETKVVLETDFENVIIKANKGRGLYFYNIPETLEKNNYERHNNVFVRCTDSEGRVYENSPIHYSTDPLIYLKPR